VTKKKKKVVAVSGGFDPIHIGHVRMILEARKLGNVIVFLNTDAWLKRKKGYVFMTWEERAEILLGIKGVILYVKLLNFISLISLQTEVIEKEAVYLNIKCAKI
jgi:cytidyltransferase-like protein